MDYCQQRAYSEEFEDFIIDYAGFDERIAESGLDVCFQRANKQFGIVYVRTVNVNEDQRNSVLIMPRCFGLLSSSQMLEEAGAARVRRQPSLSLYGQGVIVGIIDTGAGVRKAVNCLYKRKR